MRLSEAIRLGAMLKPQAYNGDLGETSCALRAAAEAGGVRDSLQYGSSELDYPALQSRWPVLSLAYARCGLCEEKTPMGNVTGAIWHLNDWHHQTREQVADFVAAIEESQAADAVRLSTDQPGVSIRVKV